MKRVKGLAELQRELKQLEKKARELNGKKLHIQTAGKSEQQIRAEVQKYVRKELGF
ncbi:MAG: hypothetical protein RH862_00015 [Leptospiraceae bacterium]